MSPRPLLAVLLLALAACSGRTDGDTPSVPPADPLGAGLRIRDVADPAKKKAGQNVTVTGASILFVDDFDETHDGKSRGTVFIQDVGSQQPYSGLSIFSPSYVPANLRVAPGDVLDFTGPYVELSNVGTAVFTPPQVLPQLDRPTGTFRYEYDLPPPRQIDPVDLNDYQKGRQWLSMLVTIKDGQLYDDVFQDTHGRASAHITPDVTVSTSATITNELFDLGAMNLKAGTKFKSITGVVTWFFSFHIAPRSAADIVLQ